MAEEVILQFLYDKCKEARWAGKNQDALIYFTNFFKVLNLPINGIDKFKMSELSDNISGTLKNLYISLLEEFTIFCYYTDYRKYGCIISDKLILSRFDNYNINMTCNNQKFYMEKIQRLERIPIKVKTYPNYVGLNASIIQYNDGYLLNGRTVNYELTDNGDYIVKDGGSIINTINYVLYMNKKFQILSQNILVDKSTCEEYNVRPITGLEDIIIFKDNENKIWCTCTTLDTNPAGIPQISLCKVSDKLNTDDEFEIISKRPIYLVEEGRAEKNWLPFVDEQNNFNFMYSYSPTITRSISNTKEVIEDLGYIASEVKIKNEIMFNFDRFRGSSGPLKFDDGYLFIVHEVTWLSNNKSRNYTHRFIYTDSEFGIKKLSLPFYFEELSVEFVRSMCYSYENDIVLTVGIKDRESWLYIIDKDYINSILYSLEYFTI
jgi:hypothetical protein